jgi:microcystin-dependent protein
MLDGHTVTRDMLIEAFSDGKTPDGSDFKSLISCMIMRSANDTAFDEKTMSMLTANDHQTQLGMQNNKFVTPLRLRNWHDKQLKPVFEDLRAKDSALEAQDAQLARVDAALQAQLDAKFLQLQNTLTGNMNTLYTRMLPIGSVIMWGLPLEQKPANFVVCDGTWHVINGVNQPVPNLSGRFALGTGNGYGFKAMAGEYDVQLDEKHMPRHSHTGTTSSAGAHNHLVGYKHGRSFKGAEDKDHPIKQQDGSEHYSNVAGNHTHSFTTNATGGNVLTGKADRHNNMPPYFALHYLIKIAN